MRPSLASARLFRLVGGALLLARLAVGGCLALGACLALGGCAALLPKLQPPQLNVTGVSFAGGNLQRQQFQLSLHVINPNDRAVAIRSLECHLELAGVPFADGVSHQAFTLPARGTTDFALDVTTDIASAVVALAAGRARRTVEYRLFGRVQLQRGLPRSLPFNHSGRVQL